MKKNTKIILAVAIAAALIGFAFLRGCQNKTSVAASAGISPKDVPTTFSPFIHPVSEKTDLPFVEYSVNAGRDTLLRFFSGTKIHVPACAFSKNGSTLSSGQVTLRYREFQSKSDLIAAGIPMTMSGNSDEFLETTGMMELRAFLGADPLEVSDGCTIKIELANSEAGSKVNLYQLDEEKRTWVEKKRELPAKIYSDAKKEKVKKRNFDESKYKKEAWKAGCFMPVKPKVANPKKYSFHFKINLQQYPELNVYDGILWEYAGKGGSDDPGQNKWVESATWREMTIREGAREGTYQLTLSTKDKSFTTTVRPVFEKEDMEYAVDIFKDRYAKYRNYMDKKNAEESSLEIQETKKKKTKEQVDLITRSFEMNQFGIWNCDRYYNLPDPMVVTMNFTTTEPGLTINRVYLIEKNINSVIQMYPERNVLKELKLKKDGQYELLLLDSEVKFHKVSDTEFANLLKTGTTLKISVGQEGFEMASANELKKWM